MWPEFHRFQSAEIVRYMLVKRIMEPRLQVIAEADVFVRPVGWDSMIGLNTFIKETAGDKDLIANRMGLTTIKDDLILDDYFYFHCWSSWRLGMTVLNSIVVVPARFQLWVLKVFHFGQPGQAKMLTTMQTSSGERASGKMRKQKRKKTMLALKSVRN